jgi:hypothetical protein
MRQLRADETSKLSETQRLGLGAVIGYLSFLIAAGELTVARVWPHLETQIQKGQP